MTRTESDLIEVMGTLLAVEMMYAVPVVVVASLYIPIDPPRDVNVCLCRAGAILRGTNRLVRVSRVLHTVAMVIMAAGVWLYTPTDRLAWLLRWGVLVYMDATLIMSLPVDPWTFETSTPDALFAVVAPTVAALLLLAAGAPPPHAARAHPSASARAARTTGRGRRCM